MMISPALARLSLLVWRPMLGMLGVGIAIAVLWAAQSIALAGIVASLLAHTPLAALGGGVALIVGIVIIRAGLIWASDVIAQYAGLRIKSTLRQNLFHAASRKGRGWLTGERTATVESALTDGVEGLEAYYARYLPQIAVALASGLGTVVWIGLIDPVVAVVLFGWHCAVPILPRLWERVVARVGTAHWDEYRSAHADFLEAMQGNTTLKTLRAETTVFERLQRRSRSLLGATLAQMRVSLIGASMSSLLVGIGTAVTIAVAIIRADSLSTVGLLTILFLTGESFRPFSALAALWHQSYMGFSAAGAIAELRDTDTQPTASADATPATADATFAEVAVPGRAPRIEFSAVSFTYPGAEIPALDDVSFVIEPGEHLGIVGPSGAGKSTIIALLLGELRPDSGSIIVGGDDHTSPESAAPRSVAPVSAAPVSAVRETESIATRFGVVHQHPHLFNGTLAYNLGVGLNPDPAAAADAEALTVREQETIRTAAASAGLDDEIAVRGLGADVGEWGRGLSGGQRQRIAVARALVHDPAVLVLDEATASVEHAKEATILASLNADGHVRTIITITHRRESLVHCDRVLTVDHGRVHAEPALSTLSTGGRE